MFTFRKFRVVLNAFTIQSSYLQKDKLNQTLHCEILKVSADF